MRRFALTLAVVLTAAVSVGASSVSAYSGGPNTPITQAANKTLVKALIRDIDAQGLANTVDRTSGLTRMQQAAKLAPRFLGPITVATVAVPLQWKFAHSAWNPAGYIYKKLTGEDFVGATQASWTPYTPQKWQWIAYASASDYFGGSWSSYSGAGIPSDGWGFRWQYTVSGAAQNLTSYCATPGSCDDAGLNWTASTAAAVALPRTLYTQSTATPGHCSESVQSCRAVIRTDAEMMRSVQLETSTQAAYDAASADAKYLSPGTFAMPSTTSDAELTDALNAVGALDAVAGDAADEAIIAAINDELEPGWNSPNFVMPAPQPNETYTAYLTRLQSLGYVGTATSTVLANELSGYGPNAPARISVPGTTVGTIRTLDPLRWPSPTPSIAKDADIALRYNPSTSPEVPTETSGGTNVVLPPTTIPPAEGIDFTPITDLDGACSFPFGFICYAQDVTDIFNVTPNAPVFEFSFPQVSVAGNTYGGSGTWAVDLEVMDDYMAIIRTLISFVLWIGAVYWLAVNLLGFRGGGDPAEAADEAIHV